MNKVIESTESGGRIYNSVFIGTKDLSAVANDLAVKILDYIANTPGSVSDIAKAIGESEQRVYYNVKKLLDAGIIKPLREERRSGLVAIVYQAASPVISAKLKDVAEEINVLQKTQAASSFFSPFIDNNKLNAKIVIGSPKPHGEHNLSAYDGVYTNDLSLFLGSMVAYVPLPCYKFDSDVTEEDLKGNMIIIGSPKVNTIAKKINPSMPIYFDEADSFSIMSKKTSMMYNEDSSGLIVKAQSPFNPRKKVLWLAGIHSEGTISSIFGVTRALEKVIGSLDTATIARVIKSSKPGYPENIHILE